MLTNKYIKRFFVEILSILIMLFLSGMIFSQIIVQDFKQKMFAHDYKVAGYLLERGINRVDVSSAFSPFKTQKQFSSGKKFLQMLGYKESINNKLFPDANALLYRYRLIFMLIVVIFGIFIITAFFIYFKHQQNEIKEANISINAFMNGNTKARIDSDKEGSLYRLFVAINSMTTSLGAHIDVEKHTKEFLKDTIADISHQLKTPLAALRMYNEIIEDESYNKETVKKFTIKTDNALERMEILIKNLMKITKFDSGTIKLNKKEKNIKRVVEKSISSFETRAYKEHKNIIINGPYDVMLYCDEDWMIEAIGNLVKNALDHMKANGKVEIAWEDSPIITKITVKDNGMGIHKEDIHNIFKRFYRSRFSQDTQGVGLGLSLVKSIVEAHNGTINVESTLEKGSIFTLDFLKLTNM